MYAVIKTGGKQYKVAEGDKLRVERLDSAEGDTVELDSVLMIADGDNLKVGTPYLEGGKVSAVVKGHGRARKIEIIKFRRRKHHRKQMGHRQYFTKIEITDIKGPGAKKAAKTKEAEAPAEDSVEPAADE